MELTNISEIKPLLERYGFSFSKSLGQNFLINAAIPVKIAENCGAGPEDIVLEIGPGIGCLTKELAKREKRVISVEIDKKLIPVLQETLAEFDNVTVINKDILEVDIKELCETLGCKELYVCANLPYYITTPIIMKLLESNAPIKCITVMVQKELAQRFCSKPNTAEYGSVTASINYRAEVKNLFTVSPGSFLPAPKVSSSVIRLDIVPPPVEVKDEKIFFRVIRAAFAMRRKTLSNNLANEFKITKAEATEIIKNCGYSETVRGEALSIFDYAKISDEIVSLQKSTIY